MKYVWFKALYKFIIIIIIIIIIIYYLQEWLAKQCLVTVYLETPLTWPQGWSQQEQVFGHSVLISNLFVYVVRPRIFLESLRIL